MFVVLVAALLLMGADERKPSPESAITLSTGSGSIKTSTTSTATGFSSKPTDSITSKTSTTCTSRPSNTITSGPTPTRTHSFNNKLPAKHGKAEGVEPLSPYAEELAKTIKFDRQVLIIVKELTREHIRRLVGYDEEDYQIVAPGIAVPVPDDKTERVLADLRKRLEPLHYTPYVVEINGPIKMNKIGVLKGTDQYEILRIMRTDGVDYDISNQDVIERLKEWEKASSFRVIGAGEDWVEIEFKILPKDLKSFVHEVTEFSPDTLMQGPRTHEKLVKEIKKTNRVRLLWD